jgi:cation diffusion facilitator family transporter
MNLRNPGVLLFYKVVVYNGEEKKVELFLEIRDCMKNNVRKSVNQQDVSQQDEREIKRITWIGLGINLILAALKFLVGALGKSQAVIADAVHSLSDMVTDFAVLFGVKFWTAPPDEDHPYGHRRIESIITTAIGIGLVVVAVGISYNALISIRKTHLGQAGWVALTGPALSVVLKEMLFRWTVTIGNRSKSSAVIANAWHHRSDALSSLPAFIAVAASALKPAWAFIDHIGALIVSLFILKVSWDIIRPALSELADSGASELERESIKEIAFKVNGVKEVHAIRTRKLGPNLYVDLHILVDPEMSVRLGHDISEEVKKDIIANGPGVIDVVVHLEPFED